jgi:2,3-bisphosphoglycerate-dependent phosphoglycerate mutase
MAARLGHQQVFDWRRGYRVRPPALRWNDPRHPRFNPRYAAIDPARLPAAESLHDTLERMLPCWQQAIVPELRAGRQVLIVAHHNSLRALVQYLDGLSETQIALLNIPTGYPLVYDLDEAQRPIRREYLGHPADVKAAADSVYRIPASIRRKLSGGEPPSA